MHLLPAQRAEYRACIHLLGRPLYFNVLIFIN